VCGAAPHIRQIGSTEESTMLLFRARFAIIPAQRAPSPFGQSRPFSNRISPTQVTHEQCQPSAVRTRRPRDGCSGKFDVGRALLLLSIGLLRLTWRRRCGTLPSCFMSSTDPFALVAITTGRRPTASNSHDDSAAYCTA